MKRFYYKGSRVKQLRALCAIARRGSVSRAAEDLFLSQPSVSLQLRALEDELGTELFDRGGGQMTLTEDGQTLYELARPLMDGLESLDADFSQRRGFDETGEVHIAAGESTILYLLPELVRQFGDTYPGIRVHLHNVTGRDGMGMIRRDEVDFAVGSMLDVPHDIEYQPLHEFAPALITPKNHPLAATASLNLEDISPYGLILPPRRLTTWRLVDRIFHEHQIPYHVSMEVGGWEVIKRYVEMGLGISIVTSICLREEDQLSRRDLSEYFPTRSYGLVARKGRSMSDQAQRFIDLLVADEPVTLPRQPGLALSSSLGSTRDSA